MIAQSELLLSKELLSSVLKEQKELFLAKQIGIERDILPSLKESLNNPFITIITGLRRVGKSTLLSQIAQRYLSNNYFFVNFEDERLLNFQVQDFDLLHETLISIFGEQKIFLFDEIQNVPDWERFVRRLHDQGFKFIITGSNASLLSQELGTRLTGRTEKIELFPFSFREYLQFKKINIPSTRSLTTSQRGLLRKVSNEYLILGGIPDALKYPNLNVRKSLYEDVIYRDIVARYQIENVKSIKELAFYLVSNPSTLISFNKLKNLLKLGSTNTIKKYVDYLESSWLFLVVNKFSFSVKEQQIAVKKVYSIDTGLAQSVGFSFSKNTGKLMENIVFLVLRRNGFKIHYYKTQQGLEIDFYLPEKNIFIQVVQNFDQPETREREIRALFAAAEEQKEKSRLIIITESDKEMITRGESTIDCMPLYDWLLHGI